MTAPQVPGSATFVLAAMSPTTGQVDIASLGDAGARVVRAGKVVAATAQQQHQFDMPFQMACEAFVTAKYDAAQDAELVVVPAQVCTHTHTHR